MARNQFIRDKSVLSNAVPRAGALQEVATAPLAAALSPALPALEALLPARMADSDAAFQRATVADSEFGRLPPIPELDVLAPK